MNETIYMVRKQGSVKVETKKQAENIIKAAAKQGYKFGQRKMGWSFIVSDLDA